MPNFAELQAALIKSGAPASDSLVKRMESMTKQIDEALEPQTFQQSGSAKKQFSSIYALSKILTIDEKPT